MLSFLPVWTEVAIFLVGAVLLMGYALLAGNGCPPREKQGPGGRRSGRFPGAAFAGGFPIVAMPPEKDDRTTLKLPARSPKQLGVGHFIDLCRLARQVKQV